MVNNKIQSVSFIGSGNVATHLAKALTLNGLNVVEVFSPQHEHANALARELNATVAASISSLQPVDLIIIAVKDDAIQDVVNQLSSPVKAVVHTSGSVDMNILKNKAEYIGVFYPVQSFRVSEPVNWPEIPICLEANNDAFTEALFQFSGLLSKNVSYLNSTQRIQLHIAAVMVNNFTNYMYSVSYDLVTKQHLSFALLLPLIKQTAARLSSADPITLQTGPAVRNDVTVIEKHLKLLEGNQEAKELYSFISDHIIKKAPK